MPRNVSTAMLAHKAKTQQTTCLLWEILRADGVTEGFTDLDIDLISGGVTYRSAAGAGLSAVSAEIGLAEKVTDVTTANASSLPIIGVTAESLAAGVYEGAQVTIYEVNYLGDLTDRIALAGGLLGAGEKSDSVITFRLSSWSALLNKPVGRATCALCPWPRFGRGNCRNVLGSNDGPDITTRTATGAVASVTSKTRLTLSGIARPGASEAIATWANDGILRFTSGVNNGVECEVKTYNETTGLVVLNLETPFLSSTGDIVALEEGCARTWDACGRKNNRNNFGGQPFVPGQQNALKRFGL